MVPEEFAVYVQEEVLEQESVPPFIIKLPVPKLSNKKLFMN